MGRWTAFSSRRPRNPGLVARLERTGSSPDVTDAEIIPRALIPQRAESLADSRAAGGDAVPDLVPVRMLNEYAYCPRLFWLECVFRPIVISRFGST